MQFRVRSVFNKVLAAGVTLFAGFAAFALLAPNALAQHYSDPDTLAPSFPTPQPVVERMLTLADVKPGEMVYDLGCGDGRIVITAATMFSARGVGIEIRRDIYEATLAKVASLGLSKQVQILHGDALKSDLTPADVVTLYLLTGSNERLRPVLEKQLKPGARVVSHDFEIKGWQPEKTEKIMFQGRPHMIYAYRMAANMSPRHK
jgi:protein-L-isoaspartate O-methyltransferase